MRTKQHAERSFFLLVAMVFLPFAAGYFLSFLFRTINALIAGRLITDLGLDAAQLGLLTSAYFITATIAQLPLGMLIDRYGPRLAQGANLGLAALGALLFALAEDFYVLFVARALIGIGIAGALIAGLKAIVMWFPKPQVALLNGCFVAFGAAGAFASSAPGELALTVLTWRELFLVLAVVTAAVSLLTLTLVPEPKNGLPPALGGADPKPQSNALWQIFTDARFWRLAPLSGVLIGTAWALQGLWASPWLKDVARLQQTDVVTHLVVMAGAMCAGALGFGVLADQLRRRGIPTQVLVTLASLSMIAALVALGLQWPVPTLLPWALMGAMGAATVLSYTIMADTFDKSIAGQANSALNMLHFGFAFAVQSAVGAIVNLWPRDALGHYPGEAYGAAFLLLAAAQFAALTWFVWPLLTSSRWLSPVLHPAALGAAALALVAAFAPSLPFAVKEPVLAYISSSAVAGIGSPARVDELAARLDALESRAAAAAPSQRLVTALSVPAQAPASPRDGEFEALKLLVTVLQQRVAQLETVSLTQSAGGSPLQTTAAIRSRPPEATHRPTSAAAAPCSGYPEGFASPAALPFDAYQGTLSPGHRALLDHLAATAIRCPNMTLSIFGFTDDRGSPSANRRLAWVRAELVANYLKERGVTGPQIAVAGRGSASPVASNKTDGGRAQNRRVEVAVRLLH